MTTREELDERYGRTRRRRAPWIALGVVAILAVAALGWQTVAQSMSTVDADDLGFEVIDEHAVTVTFQVSDVRGEHVFCAVEALDEEFGVVGWRIVEVPAGDSHSQRISETIPTVAAATTGLVNSCWVA